MFVVTEILFLGQNPEFRPRTKIQNFVLGAQSKIWFPLQNNQNLAQKIKIPFQKNKISL